MTTASRSKITFKKIFIIGIILMLCGIILSLLAMSSVTHEVRETGTQILEEGKYYTISPPKINGVYFVNSSKLIINLYRNGTIKLLIGEKIVNISTSGNITTKTIDLNCSIVPILVYVVEADNNLVMKYDYIIIFISRPLAWLVVPATLCATIGTVLASTMTISIISNRSRPKKHM